MSQIHSFHRIVVALRRVAPHIGAWCLIVLLPVLVVGTAPACATSHVEAGEEQASGLTRSGKEAGEEPAISQTRGGTETAEGLLGPYPATSVRLYADGRSKFEAMMADIEAAHHRIDIEYFIYANDSIGTAMTELLARKAREGVRVRLVVDGYKEVERDYGHTQAWCDSVREALPCFEARIFDPWRFPWVNHIARDHRKIVVVDDSIGYIGGLNVADYYIVGRPEVYGGWRDTHVRLTGPAVVGLRAYFEDGWARCGRSEREAMEAEIGSTPWSGQCVAADDASLRRLFVREAQRMTGGDEQAEVVYFERSRDSRAKKRETRRAIAAAFRSAHDSLHVVSPYFLPTRSVRRALIDAIDRGVQVDILFSKVGDEPLLSIGGYDLAKRWTRHGATVHLYRGAFHHSKIMMIDGHTAMVGSANLNSRSLRWDYEASAFIFSPEATAWLDSVFVADLARCDTFTLDAYRRETPRLRRIAGWLTNHLLTPVL